MNWIGLAAITSPIWLAALLVGGALWGSRLSAPIRRRAEILVLYPATIIAMLALLITTRRNGDWPTMMIAMIAIIVVAIAWRLRSKGAGQADS